MSFESKKEAIFRILQILWNGTGAEDKTGEWMTLNKIIERLHHCYGISLERKAVIRDIALLNEIGEVAGFEIRTTRQGSRLVSRPFDDKELCFLIDNVRASRDLAARDKSELIEKIERLSSLSFRKRQGKRDSYDDGRQRGETGSKVLDYVAKVNDAIESEKMVEYTYPLVGTDDTKEWEINPICLLLHNQRYYLAGFDSESGEMVYHRMNRISKLNTSRTDAKPLRSIKGFERGIDWRLFDYQMPYLYSGTPQPVTVRAKKSVMAQIIDWFGEDVRELGSENDTVTVTLRSNLTAMRYWALQYAESVEVLSPDSLREEIRTTLFNAYKAYEKTPTK